MKKILKSRFDNKNVVSKLDSSDVYTTSNVVVRWLANRFLRKIRDILQGVGSASLAGLNVGCGEGNMISYLHDEKVIGYMVALDLNEERLRYSKIHYPFCKHLKADVSELGFKPNIFDYILAAELFEHLVDPVKAMQEVRRVAKSNAYIIISVPHEPFFRWGNLLRGKYWERGGRTPAHVSFWNRLEFKKFLGEFIEIEEECCASTFPWLLYLGKFRDQK